MIACGYRTCVPCWALISSVCHSLQFDLCLCEQLELSSEFGVQRRAPGVPLQDDSQRVMLFIAVAIPAVGVAYHDHQFAVTIFEQLGERA
jgi:hypothetical protein